MVKSTLLRLLSIALLGICVQAQSFSKAAMWLPHFRGDSCSHNDLALFRWGVGFAFQLLNAEYGHVPVSDIPYETFKLSGDDSRAPQIVIGVETIAELEDLYNEVTRRRQLSEGNPVDLFPLETNSTSSHRRLGGICDNDECELACMLRIECDSCKRRNLRAVEFIEAQEEEMDEEPNEFRRQLSPAENKFKWYGKKVMRALQIPCLINNRVNSIQGELP